MPRQDRLDFSGAIHLVHVRGAEGRNIFFDPDIIDPTLFETGGPSRRLAPEVTRFERLIAMGGEACHVELHGYCIEANVATLLLRTIGAPLEAFMRRLCGQYARYRRFNHRLPGESTAYAARYESKVVAPEYLAHALRRVHRTPVIAGFCRNRIDYPFSSERAYLGEEPALPLQCEEVLDTLRRYGHHGRRGYRLFMDRPDTPHVARLFERGSALDPRIVGGRLYVEEVIERISHPPTPPSREQIIRAVARLMKLPESEVYASSHTGVLCRALVGWYALRAGTATLSAVAGWFSLTGAALGQSIRHYRHATPHLFRLPHLPLEEPPSPPD
jgi:hypothetical protein